MAECAFTFAQLAMALMVERAAAPAPAAALGVATFLIRSAGIASLIAGALYLATKRGWRSAAGFALVAALRYLPWAIYAEAHRPTAVARLAHGGSIAYAYADLLAMKHGGDAASGRIGVGDLPARVSANLVNVFGREIGAPIFPAAYRGPGESGQEACALSGETGLRAGSMGGGEITVVVSLALSAIAAIGFFAVLRQGLTVAEFIVAIAIGMVVLVPARTFRYVLPLAPPWTCSSARSPRRTAQRRWASCSPGWETMECGAPDTFARRGARSSFRTRRAALSGACPARSPPRASRTKSSRLSTWGSSSSGASTVGAARVGIVLRRAARADDDNLAPGQ